MFRREEKGRMEVIIRIKNRLMILVVSIHTITKSPRFTA